MPEQELNQAKDQAKEEVSELKSSMIKSVITDFTSAITSWASPLITPVISSIKNLFSSDENKKGFFENMLDVFVSSSKTLFDKINPVPELIKAFSMKSKLDATIESSDDLTQVSDIKNNVESVKDDVDFQVKADIVRTATNIATGAIPAGSIIKDVSGYALAKIAGGAVGKIVEEGIEGSADIVDFTETTPTKSIQEHKANKVLNDILDTSLNQDTVKILDSSSNNAIKDNLLVMKDQDLDNTDAVLADEFVKARENNSDNPSLSIV